MQRNGYGDKPGLLYVLNNCGDGWNGRFVTTQWGNTAFVPVSWWSAADMSQPFKQFANSDGLAAFYAPPRGYTVYVPLV